MTNPTSASTVSHCGMKQMFPCQFVDYIHVGAVFSVYAYDILFNPKSDTVMAVWDLGQETRPYDPSREDKAPDSVFDAADELVEKWIEYDVARSLSRSEPLLDRG